MASPRRLLSAASIALAAVLVSERVPAQTPDAPVASVVKPGTSLRIVLERRLIVKRVGQPVVGTLAVDVYAHDRVVFPEGAGVEGHIDAFEEAPRRRAPGGDDRRKLFVPAPRDRPVRRRGPRRRPPHRDRRCRCRGIPAACGARSRPARSAPIRIQTGVVARVREEIEQRKNAAVAALGAIKEPGTIDRLKEIGIDRLPYHPQYFGKARFSTPRWYPRSASGRLPRSQSPPPARSRRRTAS